MTGTTRPQRPRLVVVTPVFDEEDNLESYADAVTRVLLNRPDLDAHVIMVDDGSSDRSWQHMKRISSRDHRFRGVRLSRNFGAHTALSAGFLSIDDDPDVVATLACDLQDPPETVVEFVDRWRDGADIVWGMRRTREDRWWRVTTSRMFQSAMRRWAMPRGSRFTTGSFLLMDRRVLSAVTQMPEHNRITFALVAWTGFDQVQVEYDRRPRVAGTSGWGLGRMLKTMYDAFVGFSALPIRLMTMAAAGAFVVALALSIYLLMLGLIGDARPGWVSQTLLVSGFFAVQFSLVAIMGEYLQRIYAEVVRRPLFFVSDDTRERPEGWGHA